MNQTGMLIRRLSTSTSPWTTDLCKPSTICCDAFWLHKHRNLLLDNNPITIAKMTFGKGHIAKARPTQNRRKMQNVELWWWECCKQCNCPTSKSQKSTSTLFTRLRTKPRKPKPIKPSNQTNLANHCETTHVWKRPKCRRPPINLPNITKNKCLSKNTNQMQQMTQTHR